MCASLMESVLLHVVQGFLSIWVVMSVISAEGDNIAAHWSSYQGARAERAGAAREESGHVGE